MVNRLKDIYYNLFTNTPCSTVLRTGRNQTSERPELYPYYQLIRPIS